MKRSMLVFLASTLLAAAVFLPLDSGVTAAGMDVEGKSPDTVVLRIEGALLPPVRFDHRMHTYVASDCGSCHHQHQEVDVAQCGGCHEFEAKELRKVATGGFLSCRHCHGDINPDSPGMPGLKVAYHLKCFGCHLGMKGLGQGPQGCSSQCHKAEQPQE